VESIDRLREDLWNRWRRQMERSPVAVETPPGDEKVVYGHGPLFDLKTYTPRKFKPGGRSSSQPFSGHDNWVYRLDSAGRPVRMDTRHSYNGIDWRGMYQYTPEEAEYAEWCLQTGVCSQYDRVMVREEQPVAFQRLAINARGSFPAWRGVEKAKLMERIASDSMNFQILIERYDVRGGRIEGGEAYTEGMGAPPMHSTLSYAYLDGTLDRVVQHSESGEQRTVFAARRPISLRQLSADLSRRIAERTVDLVLNRGSELPLAALELSYRSVETYAPLIIPCTDQDAIPDLCLTIAIDASRWIRLPEEELAPAITDFHERLRTTGVYVAGTQMLREAARQVTALARRQLRTSEFFVAYAIDWESEGDQLESILQDCGATAESLREFRSRGWI
jgi:hypothetical protein